MTIINETRVARAPQSIPNQIGHKVEGMRSGRAEDINLYNDSFIMTDQTKIIQRKKESISFLTGWRWF